MSLTIFYTRYNTTDKQYNTVHFSADHQCMQSGAHQTNRTVPRGTQNKLLLAGDTPVHTGHLHSNTQPDLGPTPHTEEGTLCQVSLCRMPTSAVCPASTATGPWSEWRDCQEGEDITAQCPPTWETAWSKMRTLPSPPPATSTPSLTSLHVTSNSPSRQINLTETVNPPRYK